MSAFVPTRRRAEAFASAVDAPVDGSVDARFAELVELVAELRDVAVAERVAPAAGFTADLRERLMVAAETDLVPTDERLLLPGSGRRSETVRRRRLVAGAAVAAVLAGTTGVAAASASSVPGESLYPFKRGVEQAHQVLSVGQAAEGRDQLGQARARLGEVQGLLDGKGDATRLPATLAAFSRNADDGGALLLRDYRANGDTRSADQVRDFAGSAMATLQSLSDQAPAALQPALTNAADVLVTLDRRAAQLCPDCGARPPLQAGTALRPAAAASLDDVLGTRALADAAQAVAQRRVADDDGRAADDRDASDSGGTKTGGDQGTKTGDGTGGTGVVKGVVGGVVGGVSGSTGKSTTGGGTKGSGGAGAVVKDPVGSILGSVTDTAKSVTGGVTKGVTGGS